MLQREGICGDMSNSLAILALTSIREGIGALVIVEDIIITKERGKVDVVKDCKGHLETVRPW